MGAMRGSKDIYLYAGASVREPHKQMTSQSISSYTCVRDMSCMCHRNMCIAVPPHLTHSPPNPLSSTVSHPSCTSLLLFLGYVLDLVVRLSPPVLTSDCSGWQRHSPRAPRFDCFQVRESCSEKYHAITLASFDISLLRTNLPAPEALIPSSSSSRCQHVYTSTSVQCVRV